MSNHFHILLEIPPLPVGGLGDEELLKRLEAIYNDALVASVADPAEYRWSSYEEAVGGGGKGNGKKRGNDSARRECCGA